MTDPTHDPRLDLFCDVGNVLNSDHPDRHRYDVATPWCHKGWWYATDGRILVRVRAAKGSVDCSIEKKPRAHIGYSHWPKAEAWRNHGVPFYVLENVYLGIRSALYGKVCVSAKYLEMMLAAGVKEWLPHDSYSIWFRADNGLCGLVMGVEIKTDGRKVTVPMKNGGASDD